MIFIPIYPFLNMRGTAVTGKYRIVFKDVKDFSKLPDISEPKKYRILGKEIVIERTEKDPILRLYYIFIEIVTNPVPILGLTIGILTILGLSLAYMTFSKVDKIIDNPTGELFIFVLLAVAIIFGINYARKFIK